MTRTEFVKQLLKHYGICGNHNQKIYYMMGNGIIYLGNDELFFRTLQRAFGNDEISLIIVHDATALPKENDIARSILIIDGDKEFSCIDLHDFKSLGWPGPTIVAVSHSSADTLSTETIEQAKKIIIKTNNPSVISKSLEGLICELKLLDKKPINDNSTTKNQTLKREISSLQQQLSEYDNNLQSHEDTIDKLNQIKLLARKINCLNMEQIATVCIEQIPDLIAARFASLYIYDNEKNTLQLLQHNHPYQISRIVNIESQPDTPMAIAVQDKKIMFIKDFTDKMPAQCPTISRMFARNYQTNSCIIAPLLSGNRVLGILNLADKLDGDTFDTASDLSAIELLCEITGSAMNNIELYEQVQKRARTDGMTKLLNHRTFYKVLDREINRARRYNNSLSLIMIDLDELKQINDTKGHRAGDAVIIHTAKIISQCVRETDLAARYGGDEFAVILPNTSLAEAYYVAERISEMVTSECITFDGMMLKASVSVGLGQYTTNNSIEEFMTETDSALFKAKHSGKNCVKIS